MSPTEQEIVPTFEFTGSKLLNMDHRQVLVDLRSGLNLQLRFIPRAIVLPAIEID